MTRMLTAAPRQGLVDCIDNYLGDHMGESERKEELEEKRGNGGGEH